MTATPACAHDACWPGARLTFGCDSCVTAVCTSMQSCCSTAWTSACVAAADASGSCACTPPTLAASNTLQPATQTTADSTPVLVLLANEPNPAVDGYTFTLILTKQGDVDGTAFSCGSYSSVQHTCTATVTGLVEGTYDATVQVADTGLTPQPYLTAAVTSAFTVTAPSGVVLTGLDPNVGSSAMYPIHTSVNFTGGAVGNTYVLNIFNTDTFPTTCTVGAILNQCDAYIDSSGSKPIGLYDVYLTVTPSGGSAYDTNTIAKGFEIQ